MLFVSLVDIKIEIGSRLHFVDIIKIEIKSRLHCIDIDDTTVLRELAYLDEPLANHALVADVAEEALVVPGQGLKSNKLGAP